MLARVSQGLTLMFLLGIHSREREISLDSMLLEYTSLLSSLVNSMSTEDALSRKRLKLPLSSHKSFCFWFYIFQNSEDRAMISHLLV